MLGGHLPPLRGTKEPRTESSSLLRAVASGQKETTQCALAYSTQAHPAFLGQ